MIQVVGAPARPLVVDEGGVDNIMDEVVIGSAATAITKVMVDGLKLAWPSAPTWVVLGVAFLLSILNTFAVYLHQGGLVNQQMAAGNYIVAVGVFAGSVGLTELQKRADANRAKAQEASGG